MWPEEADWQSLFATGPGEGWAAATWRGAATVTSGCFIGGTCGAEIRWWRRGDVTGGRRCVDGGEDLRHLRSFLALSTSNRLVATVDRFSLPPRPLAPECERWSPALCNHWGLVSWPCCCLAWLQLKMDHP